MSSLVSIFMFVLSFALVFTAALSCEGRLMGVGAERSGKGCEDEDADTAGGAAGEEFSLSFRFCAFHEASEAPFGFRDC